MRTVAMLSRGTSPAENSLVEGNTGNLVYRNAVHRQVEYHEMLDWGEFDRIAESKAGVFVMPLANVFRKDYDIGGAWLSDFLSAIGDRTLVGIGLGADGAENATEANPPDATLRWTRRFDFIWTRGERTSAILGNHGIHSTPGVCPSLFECVRTPTFDKRNIVVTANPNANGRSIASFQAILRETSGPIIVQGTRRLLDALDPRNPEVIQEELGTSGCVTRLLTFYDLREWGNFLRRHDIVVSPRFHCAALAFSVGVPAVVSPSDLRCQELCESFGMPTLPWNDLEGYRERITFDASKFKLNRARKLEAYLSFLRKAGVPARICHSFD